MLFPSVIATVAAASFVVAAPILVADGEASPLQNASPVTRGSENDTLGTDQYIKKYFKSKAVTDIKPRRVADIKAGAAASNIDAGVATGKIEAAGVATVTSTDSGAGEVTAEHLNMQFIRCVKPAGRDAGCASPRMPINDDPLTANAIHKGPNWNSTLKNTTTTRTIKVPSHSIGSFRPKRFHTLAKPDVYESEAAVRKLVPRYSIDPSLCTWAKDTPNFEIIPSSCGVSWLQIINKWRAAYNKSPLAWSPHNAQISYTAGLNNLGGARAFQHTDLRAAGSHGETATPGYVMPPNGANMHGTTPFEGALLAWLCEVPGPELNPGGVDLCKHLVADTNRINVAGQRGHHDAFLNDYKSIGCWFTYNTQKPEGVFAGVYVCNFSR